MGDVYIQGADMIPFGNEPWFRWLLGWLMPPRIAFLKFSTTPAVRKMRLHRAGRFELSPGVSFSRASTCPRVTLSPSSTSTSCSLPLKRRSNRVKPPPSRLKT